MKPMELNKEQRERLTEMFEALFTEYKTFDFRMSCDYCLDGTLVIAKEEKPEHNHWVLTHWYEFCMTELAEKIFVPDPQQIQRGLKDRMCNFFWATNLWWSEQWKEERLEFADTWCKHPVDYLFDEFKKQQRGIK